MRLIISCIIVTLLCLTACTGDNTSRKTSSNVNTSLPLKFTRVSDSGVKFINTVEETPTFNHFVWDAIYNGAGVAVGDINNDGLIDLYMGSNFGDDKLYLNKGDMKFEDITPKAKINASKRISSGINMIDINKDGLVDIYVSKYGYSQNPADRRNELYINNGNQTFTESAQKYGVDNTGYTIQSTFLDYDKDGDLDLYVMNQPSNAREIRKTYVAVGAKDSQFMDNNTSDCLYQNNGDNTFTNVSEQMGIRNFSYGLGVVASDINQDGYTDIFVANDYDKPDLLYLNQKGKTFKETAHKSFDHISNFSMGTDIEDVNNDGLPDIGVLDMAGATHERSKTNMPSMSAETFWSSVNKGLHYQYMHNALHLNQGEGQFVEVANLSGIAKTDWSWSLLINDFDNDSYEDIYITNGIKRDIRNNDYIENTRNKIKKTGTITDLLAVVQSIPSNPLPNYLYINDGNLHFDDKAADTGLGTPGFSNGAAYADFDNDGDLDLVVNNVNAEADIFQNNASSKGNSLRLQFKTSSNHRPVVNTIATVYAGDLVKRKEYVNARGFMSTSEPVIHFGLGNLEEIDSVVIQWPDNNESVHKDLKLNVLNIVDQSSTKKTRRYQQPNAAKQYVSPVKTYEKLAKHNENRYDAFAKQILLPYEPSELGPFIAVEDLNGDSQQDIILGGSDGQATQILTQQQGKFSVSILDRSEGYEDMEILTFDANGDGHQDIYICSAGYEEKEGDGQLNDRVYINNGQGSFTLKTIKGTALHTGVPIAGDFDKDGDQDIVVFGRVKSGAYPLSPESYYLENDGKANFSINEDQQAGLGAIGMVTDACLIDSDIYYVAEWGTPSKLTRDSAGRWKSTPLLDDLKGLWFSITPDDIDGDGDIDFVLGNIGKNIKFKASKEKPFQVYANDFDNNGKSDIILATYSGDKVVPVRGKECSTEQLPELQSKFKSYESFATAGLADIYNLNQAEKYTVNTLASGVLWNEGGSWTFKKLPAEAQISPVNASIIRDVDQDGKKDIIIVGNLYAMEVETTRLDAGKGLVLTQNDDHSFYPVSPQESGLFAKGDAKDMEVITIKGKDHLVISMNDDYLQFHQLK